MSGLHRRLRDLARARVLLVVCDYDGTLAPVVDDPSRAWPDAAAMEALVGLGRLPGTHACIVSGRAMGALLRLAGAPAGVTLIGGHGAEADGVPPLIAPEQRQRLDELVARFRSIAQAYPGSRVEDKPVSAVFHYRQVDPAQWKAAADEASRLADEFPDLRKVTGKCVVEFLGADVHKGGAIAALTERFGADRVLFVGDDLTDEDGFAALRPDDVGVKVGRGRSLARYRVRDVPAVATTLRRLLELRRLAQRPGSGTTKP